MKFLCEHCESLDAPAEFEVVQDTLALRCAHCQQESRMSKAVAAPVPVEDALFLRDDEVPEGHCPKCIAFRPEHSKVCRHCGLDFSQFRAEDHEASDTLAQAWKVLRRRWDQPSAHDQVLAQAAAQGELPAVGRLYRIHLARLPNDALAQRGRQEVLRLVTVAASLAPSSPEESVARLKWGIAVLVLVTSVAIAGYFLFGVL